LSVLEGVKIKGTKYLQDLSGAFVLHVDNPHALIQAVGYLKFTAQPYDRIFLRGQRKLYESLSPTLYRGIKSSSSQANRHKILNETLTHFRKECSIFSKFPEYAHEPILQHYGIQTSWIDVVDNVWVALWFSVFQAFSHGKHNELLHFEQRKTNGSEEFGYILLLSASDDRRQKASKGTLRSNSSELIDLRIAAPSIFLRPHAQHGLLFRTKGTEGVRTIDYSEAIRGVLRYKLEDALSWLGSGNMVGVRGLFPPPYYDLSYGILLSAAQNESLIGTIQHVGA
jgi:FRG domain